MDNEESWEKLEGKCLREFDDFFFSWRSFSQSAADEAEGLVVRDNAINDCKLESGIVLIGGYYLREILASRL